jgi:hypothetical protein
MNILPDEVIALLSTVVDYGFQNQAKATIR